MGVVVEALEDKLKELEEIVEEDKDPFEVEDRIVNILEVDKDLFGVEPMSK